MSRNAFPLPSKIRALLLPASACVALLVTGAGARAWLSTGKVPTAHPDPAATAADQPDGATGSVPNPARLESEHVTIRPAGFEPAQITRPAGRVLLAVNDRSGLGGLVLRLEVEGRNRLYEVRVPQDTRGRYEWRQVVDLPPGAYVVTEAAHPDWACRITITPN